MPAIAGHWLTAKCARDDALVRATARSRICDARLQVITRWPNAPRRTSAGPDNTDQRGRATSPT